MTDEEKLRTSSRRLSNVRSISTSVLESFTGNRSRSNSASSPDGRPRRGSDDNPNEGRQNRDSIASVGSVDRQTSNLSTNSESSPRRKRPSQRRKNSTDSLDIPQLDASANDESAIHQQDRTVNFSRDLFAIRGKGRRASVHDSDKGKEEEEDDSTDLSRLTLVLLFIVGLVAGLVSGLALWTANLIGSQQVRLIHFGDNGKRWGYGGLYLCASTMMLTAGATLLGKLSKSKAVFGSGMPEMKALLASEFTNKTYPQIVSFKILFVRMVSMIMVLGSGLAVGGAGPLVHICACIAYLLMRYVPEFGDIFESPSLTKQIFAASAAVGLTAVFNAPVGGLLFSVEVTSTYYLISNYWKSFMAATAGAVTYQLVLLAREDATTIRVFDIAPEFQPYRRWEFALFVLLGLMVGYLSRFYLITFQWWLHIIKPFNQKHAIKVSALVGLLTAVFIYTTKSYSLTNLGGGAMVRDILTTADIQELSFYEGMSRKTGLAISFVLRWILITLAARTWVPAGLFTPMFLLGGIFGRLFGAIVQDFLGNGIPVYLPGYAMVGAVAFVSGTTHTISAAVIAIEMTGQMEMLLPCLIGAVVASGITANKELSLYDQGMVNKGLESFQLLLLGGGGYQHAQDIVDKDVKLVARMTTVGDLFELFKNEQVIYPVINNLESKKLVGSITRNDVFHYLKKTFTQHELFDYVRQRLPDDTREDDERTARYKAKAQHRWRKRILPTVSNADMLTANNDDESSSTPIYLSGRVVSSVLRRVGAIFGMSPAAEPIDPTDNSRGRSRSNTDSDRVSPRSLGYSDKGGLLLSPGSPYNGSRGRYPSEASDSIKPADSTMSGLDSESPSSRYRAETATSTRAGASASAKVGGTSGDRDNDDDDDDDDEGERRDAPGTPDEAAAAALLLTAFLRRRASTNTRKTLAMGGLDVGSGKEPSTPEATGSAGAVGGARPTSADSIGSMSDAGGGPINLSGNTVNRGEAGTPDAESPTPDRRVNRLPPLEVGALSRSSPSKQAAKSPSSLGGLFPASPPPEKQAAAAAKVLEMKKMSSTNFSSEQDQRNRESSEAGNCPNAASSRGDGTDMVGQGSILSASTGMQSRPPGVRTSFTQPILGSVKESSAVGGEEEQAQIPSAETRQLSSGSVGKGSGESGAGGGGEEEPSPTQSEAGAGAVNMAVSDSASSAAATAAAGGGGGAGAGVTSPIAGSFEEKDAADVESHKQSSQSPHHHGLTVDISPRVPFSNAGGNKASSRSEGGGGGGSDRVPRGWGGVKSMRKSILRLSGSGFAGNNTEDAGHSSASKGEYKPLSLMKPTPGEDTGTSEGDGGGANNSGGGARAGPPLDTSPAVASAAAAFMRKRRPLEAAALQAAADQHRRPASFGGHNSSSSGGVISRLAQVAQNVVKLSASANRGRTVSVSKEEENRIKLANLLKSSVDVVKEPMLPINAFPFIAHEKTPMEHIYVLFEMVKVSCIFVVTGNKKLQGMISKDHLLKRLKEKAGGGTAVD